ncbi:MAG: hypothetical protein WDN45_02635 [Caulobacteraceae bacterium]
MILPRRGRLPVWRLLDGLSKLAIPWLVLIFPLYAALRRIPVYEEFIRGAKEGFGVAVRIPSLCGGHVPGHRHAARGRRHGPDRRPAAAPHRRRPLPARSGAHGPDPPVQRLGGAGRAGRHPPTTIRRNSLPVLIAGTLYGCSETTFYVIAVYFGAVGIRKNPPRGPRRHRGGHRLSPGGRRDLQPPCSASAAASPGYNCRAMGNPQDQASHRARAGRHDAGPAVAGRLYRHRSRPHAGRLLRLLHQCPVHTARSTCCRCSTCAWAPRSTCAATPYILRKGGALFFGKAAMGVLVGVIAGHFLHEQPGRRWTLHGPVDPGPGRPP